MSATTLLFTVITLRLHHEMKEATIPQCARLMVKLFKHSLTSNGRGKLFSANYFNNNAHLRQEMMSGRTDLNKNSNVIAKEVSSRDANSQSLDIKWEYVSDAFDIMIFLILLVTQLIASTVFLIFMIL